MNKEINDKLHYYLSYNLKVQCADTRDDMLLFGLSGDNTVECVDIVNNEMCRLMAIIKEDDDEYIKPYFRPLSSLTKPIKVEGYNNGEPFTPIEEIRDRTGEDVEVRSDSEGNPIIGVKNEYFYGFRLDRAMDILELLFQWHFWLWDNNLFTTGEILEIED